ncbi:ABC transporter ATP-binding protein [Azorhizobium oxalatiphilum]|uniref:ABC transporter ATP-binding protein n=1 Tax=Azorhizobium oxalatiphilum TaxID=980631 RepID=A0A917BWR4_9HYPH|nr:ABC transporter ATP-binding protein [Azorhizobium oxalatiphilum]GGF58661.1 ABC transporter ATP-binding protein [Azorhizobium oxalatiphilum]
MTDAGPALLEVNNLTTHFHTPRGPLRAVDGVSFSLRRGQTLGIVGESGSGKSALARTIIGILSKRRTTTTGRIAFEGRDLLTLSEPDMRDIRGRDIAMVFQDPTSSLNPVKRIGVQITEVLARHLGLRGCAARSRATELLTSVGLSLPEERLHQYPHQLSGGMRQRVAIAIALACDPKLLIADEPTTSLDVTIQAQILDLLHRRQKAHDMAMILISHDLGVVAGYTDAVAVMYAGQVVEQASTRSLFRNCRMPYTAALMRSAPNLSDPPHTRLRAIAGRPPDMVLPPPGCRFGPRCDHATDICRNERPTLSASDAVGAHLYACWHPVASPGASA